MASSWFLVTQVVDPLGSIHTLEENAEALVAATREIELEVNAD